MPTRYTHFSLNSIGILHKMKTRSNVHMCPKCFYLLQAYGYPCSSLIDLALGHYVRNIPLTFTENSHELFQKPLAFLEKKGFLLSTEISNNSIQILPNLSKSCHLSPNSTNDSEDNERRFCWC